MGLHIGTDVSKNSAGSVYLPIISVYAGDELYRPLLEEFVTGLAHRLHEILSAAQKPDLTDMRRLSHKLRGSAAIYGFPQLVDVLHEFELNPESADELVQLCETIRTTALRHA